MLIQLALKGHGLRPCRKIPNFGIGAAESRALSKRALSRNLPGIVRPLPVASASISHRAET